MGKIALVALFVVSSFAHANDLWSALVGGVLDASLRSGRSPSSSSSESGGSRVGNPWALGFGYGRQKGFGSGTIDEDASRGTLDNTRMYFLQGESQIAGPLIFFTELSYYDSRNLTATYQGQLGRSVELYMTGMSSSFMLRPNNRGLRPFLKGGYYVGHSVLSDPSESVEKGMGKIVDEEGKFMRGPVAGAGFEIDLAAKAGLRLSYDHFWFESDKFNRLGDKSLQMELDRVSAAIFFRP